MTSTIEPIQVGLPASVKMNRVRFVVLMACTLCFATICWLSSTRLSFEEFEDCYEAENSRDIQELEELNGKKLCKCNVCISDGSPWLNLRFRDKIDPFLTAGKDMPEEDFRWWRKLQLERGDIRKFKSTKERFFRMFPGKPHLIEASPDRCRTCAVVGNSGNLKGSNYGKQIDQQDVVIRMNSARTFGYEKDVGTKTTHHVMYPESAVNLDDNTHLVLFPFKLLDFEWLMRASTTGFYGRSYGPIRSRIKANKNLVMVINPGFMKYVHESWLYMRGRYSSTGFMTVVLALHICDEVKVFGFGADKDGNWNHYWEPLRDKHLRTGVHPGSYEYFMIQELAKQKKVTFYRGW